MYNAFRPSPHTLPFLDPKNRAHVRIAAQGAREEILRRLGLKSALGYVAPYLPNDPRDHLQNSANPLTWAQLLRMPTSIPSRIFWAALTFDALRADAAEHHIILRNRINQQLEEAKENAEGGHKRREETISDDELTAGELDKDYNSPSAIDELEESEKLDNEHAESMAKAASTIAGLYASSYDELQHALNMPEDPELMTDEQVNHWVEQNHGPEYQKLREHMLNSISEHSVHFGLERIALVDSFVNRFAAMMAKADKTLNELEQLSPAMIGHAFDKHHENMENLANQMEKITLDALNKAGASPLPTAPTPAINFGKRVDAALLEMNAPGLHDQPEPKPTKEWLDQRWGELRLAAIQAIYPALQTNESLKMKFPDPSHGPSPKEPSTTKQLYQQIGVYAQKLGVSLQALVAAADHTLTHQIWKNAPDVRASMEAAPLIEPEKKNKTKPSFEPKGTKG